MLKKNVTFLIHSLTNNQSLKDYFHPISRLFVQRKQNDSSAKVVKIRKENDKTFTLVLKPKKNWGGFIAGQFISISCEVNGRYLSRTFSISSAPIDFQSSGIIELTIQKQNHGKVTPLLEEAFTPGDKISISKAQGEFRISENNKPKLFIAGGSGITPFRSLIRSLPRNTQMSITLMYYANNDSHLFREEFTKLAAEFKSIDINLINSTDEGRINNNHLQKYCPDFINREVYICGPGQMIQTTKELLAKKVAEENIYYEYFGTPPIYDIKAKQQKTVVFAKSGTHVDETQPTVQTLLELAESKGLKPKNSCRMGVCHQCVCKKTSGVIYNILTKSYSDSGAQNIQPCVSVAVGDVTVEL